MESGTPLSSPPSSPSSSAPSATSAYGSSSAERVEVTTTELAALLKCSDQTIHNYREDGLAPLRQNARGAFVFDRDKALAWIKANRAGTSHGGRRARSGRKPRWKTGGSDVGFTPGQDGGESPLARAAREVAREPSFDTATQELVHKLMMGQATSLEVSKLTQKLTKADFERVQVAIASMRSAHDLAVKKAEVVSAAETLEEWKNTLEKIRRQIEGLPPRISGRIMAEAELEGAKEPIVRAAVAAVLVGFIAELQAA